MHLVGFVSKVTASNTARAWPYSSDPVSNEPVEKAHVQFYVKADWDMMFAQQAERAASVERNEPYSPPTVAPNLKGHLDLFNAPGEGPALGSHFEIEIP